MKLLDGGLQSPECFGVFFRKETSNVAPYSSPLSYLLLRIQQGSNGDHERRITEVLRLCFPWSGKAINICDVSECEHLERECLKVAL